MCLQSWAGVICCGKLVVKEVLHVTILNMFLQYLFPSVHAQDQ